MDQQSTSAASTDHALTDGMHCSVWLPRTWAMKIDICAAEMTMRLGKKIYRADVFRLALSEYIERNGL